MYQRTIEYLNKCVENNILSHAYIFYGPDEDGKKEVTHWFANKIFDCQEAWHPDLFIIKPEVSDEVIISSVRQLKKFLSLSPYSAEYKVVIIENGEKLNSYAQNALLKTFEEAPAHAIIILCVKTADSILETIASRGIKIPFWRITEKAADKELNNIFNKLIESNFSERYNLIEKLTNRESLSVFYEWLKFLRNKFLENPNSKTAKVLIESQNIYFKLNETNYNPKFAFDELVLNLNHGNFGKI